MRIAIIGAGVTGIAAGDKLTRSGIDVEFFDKGRNIGGRLASRKVELKADEAFWVDHGAPCVAGSSAEFLTFLAEATHNGNAISWVTRRPHVGESIIGSTNMPNLLTAAAANLKINLQTTVTEISRRNDQFILHLEDRKTQAFDKVVLTAPPKHSAQLICKFDDVFDILQEQDASPTWTLILGFEKRLPTDIQEVEDIGIFSRIIRNERRPTRQGEAFVVHANEEWTQAHLGISRDEAINLLTEELHKTFKIDFSSAVYQRAHRWLYGQTKTPLGKPFVQSTDGNLFAAGDWCLGNCADDGFTSGSAVAKAILEQIES